MPDTFAYTCSYVPVEIIFAAGYIPVRLSGSPDCCRHEETDLSRNVCPYAHAILNDFRDNREDIAGVIVTDSCDAMKKVFDVLHLEGNQVYMLSVPRKITDNAENYFSGQLRELYHQMCRVSGADPESARLTDSIALYRELREELEMCWQESYFPSYAEYFAFRQKIYHEDPRESLDRLREMKSRPPVPGNKGGIPVIITGSPMPGEGIFSVIEDTGFSILVNDSCLDARWDPHEEVDIAPEENPFGYLCRLYLNKTPCARMEGRKRELEKLEALYPEQAKGIIHFRMPFCDLFGFDLVHLLDRTGKQAVLPLETDGSAQSEGQIRTRVQAFAEMIGGEYSAAQQENIVTHSGNIYCGIDIGSTTVDGVLLDEQGNIVNHRIIKTGPGAEKAAMNMFQEMLEDSRLSEDSIASIIATGYGRESLDFAHDAITEISCHARGILHLLPGTRFVVDIGGQDSKVIKIEASGNVHDFQMNDKCAAGTGRFLEVMAGALEIDLPQMSEYSRFEGDTVPISSVCTVFAESEVISLLGKGHKVTSIVKGIYTAITNRLEGMVRRVGLETPAAVTGGGALNRGLIEHLESRLGVRFSTPRTPQIVGAVGAALFGMDGKGRV